MFTPLSSIGGGGGGGSSVTMDLAVDPQNPEQYNGFALTGAVASVEIERGQLVYWTAGGEWDLADANDEAKIARGVALNNALATEEVKVLVVGTMNHAGFAFGTANAALWLEASALGIMTINPPAFSGAVNQKIGWVLGATTAYFNFSGEYVVLA